MAVQHVFRTFLKGALVCAPVLALYLFAGAGTSKALLPNPPLPGPVNGVTKAAEELVNPVTAPVRSAPAPAPLPTPSVPPPPKPPSSSPVKLPNLPPPVKAPTPPSVNLPSSGASTTTAPIDGPKTVTGVTKAATDAVAPGTGTGAYPLSGAAGSGPAAAGGAGRDSIEATTAATPQGVSGQGSAQGRSMMTEGGSGQGSLKDLRIATPRNWFVYVWPAVAVAFERTSMATSLNLSGGTISRLVSNVLGTFGGDPSAVTTATVGAVAGVQAENSSGSSSPLSSWFASDPPLPIAIFWIALTGGVALIFFVVRRELGLAGSKRRWRV